MFRVRRNDLHSLDSSAFDPKNTAADDNLTIINSTAFDDGKPFMEIPLQLAADISIQFERAGKT
jgi:hypothetical protein